MQKFWASCAKVFDMFRELQAATCKLDQYVSCLINSRREITGPLLEKIVVAFLLEDKVTDSLKAVTALCFLTKPCFEDQSFQTLLYLYCVSVGRGSREDLEHGSIAKLLRFP